jgi:hypothetical protein
MPKNSLGSDDWKRKKQIKTMIWVIVAAVVFGCAVAGFILLSANKR